MERDAEWWLLELSSYCGSSWDVCGTLIFCPKQRDSCRLSSRPGMYRRSAAGRERRATVVPSGTSQKGQSGTRLRGESEIRADQRRARERVSPNLQALFRNVLFSDALKNNIRFCRKTSPAKWGHFLYTGSHISLSWCYGEKIYINYIKTFF